MKKGQSKGAGTTTAPLDASMRPRSQDRDQHMHMAIMRKCIDAMGDASSWNFVTGRSSDHRAADHNEIGSSKMYETNLVGRFTRRSQRRMFLPPEVLELDEETKKRLLE